MESAILISAIVFLFGCLIGVVKYVRILHKDQLDECREGRKDCENRDKAKQLQIDALIEGDLDRARSLRQDERETDEHPIQQDPPPPAPHPRRRLRRILGLTALLIVNALIYAPLAGCAAKSESRKDTSNQHTESINISGSIYLPPVAPEFKPQEVPVALHLERTAIDSTVETSQTKTAIDGEAMGRQAAGMVIAGLKQAFPALSALSGLTAAAQPPKAPTDWGTLAATGTGLLVTVAAAAKAAQNGTRAGKAEERAKAAEQERDFHKADAAEGYAKADAHAARAETYALQLPPERQA